MQIAISISNEFPSEEWWDLWSRDPHATPFQSPAWLLPWRRHFSEGDTVVLSLRKEARLVGLLPFFRLDGRLMLWGAGTTDWLGGLLDPVVEKHDLCRALAALNEPLEFFQLPMGCSLASCPAPEGWQDRRAFSEACLVLSLPAKLGRKARQNLRYYRQRAAAYGIGPPREGRPIHIKNLADPHTRRWNAQEEPGVFADKRFLAWQEDAAPLLQQRGLLRLYVMQRDEAVVAAIAVLAGKGRAMYYIGGFDPALRSLGLGTILIGHAIAEAQRAGSSAFDFLRGQESYKYRWGAVEEPSHARYLAPGQMRL